MSPNFLYWSDMRNIAILKVILVTKKKFNDGINLRFHIVIDVHIAMNCLVFWNRYKGSQACDRMSGQLPRKTYLGSTCNVLRDNHNKKIHYLLRQTVVHYCFIMRRYLRIERFSNFSKGLHANIRWVNLTNSPQANLEKLISCH